MVKPTWNLELGTRNLFSLWVERHIDRIRGLAVAFVTAVELHADLDLDGRVFGFGFELGVARFTGKPGERNPFFLIRRAYLQIVQIRSAAPLDNHRKIEITIGRKDPEPRFNLFAHDPFVF